MSSLCMQDVEPEEDYILVIDADMIFRSPFIPEKMGVSPGSFHAFASCVKEVCQILVPAMLSVCQQSMTSLSS